LAHWAKRSPTGAAGNPFFAEEIVRELAERGVLRGEPGAYLSTAEIAEVSVPATLQAAIAARIDRLDPKAKFTLSAAAVIGLRFTPELVTALGIDPVVDELARVELVAEHLEAAGDGHAAFGWHMRAAHWATNRDIAAARLSWERATLIADALPAEDPHRAAMRIAPRTMLCGTAFRVHVKVAGDRFEELRELCTAAGDKASLAIGMAA
jgi:hypothetical protein